MERLDPEQLRRDHPLNEVAARFGVKLTQDGREWRAKCPFHAEDTPSFTIFAGKTGTQKFHCFGCGTFGDVVDFVCEWEGLDAKKDFRRAVELLGGYKPVSRRAARPAWRPPPDDAPAVTVGARVTVWNPKRGRFWSPKPTLVHPYPGHGYVIRIEFEPGKKFTPCILWARRPDDSEGWTHGPMPEPRPLYRREQLDGLDRTDGVAGEKPPHVLIVEGEKCADAAAAVLTDYCVVSWCGGGKAWRKTDWIPLTGRDCTLWPDNDAPGQQTMGEIASRLVELGAHVTLMERPTDKPDGWDVADAIQNDWWDADDLVQFIKERSRVIGEPAVVEVLITGENKPESDPGSSAGSPITREEVMWSEVPSGGQGTRVTQSREEVVPGEGCFAADTPPVRENVTQPTKEVMSRSPAVTNYGGAFAWHDRLITNDDGKMKPRLANNWQLMLRHHADTIGLFAWNDVTQGIFVMRSPPWEPFPLRGQWTARPLVEADIYNARVWLEQRGLTPHKNEARDTIRNIAAEHRYNPVRDYLAGLKWDGVPRLSGGMWEGSSVQPLSVEYLGAPDDPIFATFVRKWHVAAVARIFRPGCKVDNIIILEGKQGRMKSTYVRKMATIEGHEYFADRTGDITSDASIMLMHGVWLVEDAELGATKRTEVSVLNAWLTRTTDRFIPKYESEPREIPRHFVIAGTHNPSGHGFLKDPTGARRFWPVPVSQIDLDAVERDRDQIWAEAVTLFNAGEKWWSLTDHEQIEADALTTARRAQETWGQRIDEYIATNGVEITLPGILSGIGLPVFQHTDLAAKRIEEYLYFRGYAETTLDGGKRVWMRTAVVPDDRPEVDDGLAF